MRGGSPRGSERVFLALVVVDYSTCTRKGDRPGYRVVRLVKVHVVEVSRVVLAVGINRELGQERRFGFVPAVRSREIRGGYSRRAYRKSCYPSYYSVKVGSVPSESRGGSRPLRDECRNGSRGGPGGNGRT